MAGVGALCKAFMSGLCATRVEGAHILHAALQRPPGQVRLPAAGPARGMLSVGHGWVPQTKVVMRLARMGSPWGAACPS